MGPAGRSAAAMLVLHLFFSLPNLTNSSWQAAPASSSRVLRTADRGHRSVRTGNLDPRRWCCIRDHSDEQGLIRRPQGGVSPWVRRLVQRPRTCSLRPGTAASAPSAAAAGAARGTPGGCGGPGCHRCCGEGRPQRAHADTRCRVCPPQDRAGGPKPGNREEHEPSPPVAAFDPPTGGTCRCRQVGHNPDHTHRPPADRPGEQRNPGGVRPPQRCRGAGTARSPHQPPPPGRHQRPRGRPAGSGPPGTAAPTAASSRR